MVTGDITLFLAALDRPWGDPAVGEATERLGEPVITDSTAGDVAIREARFAETGVLLQFRSDRLASVVFTVFDGPKKVRGGGTVTPFGRESRASYPWIDTLIGGITGHSTRADVRAVLGEPLRTWWAYDEYLVGERVLSVTFYGQDFEDLVEVKVFHEDPVVLKHDIPWSPVARRRDGRIFLSVPISLGVADTIWEFEITTQQVAKLADRSRFEVLMNQISGTSDREKIRSIIEDV